MANMSVITEQGRFLGEEFILWLWMRGLMYGGSSGQDGDTSVCFVDDSISLVSEHGDVKELSLNKGNPSESREAFEALSRGLRPSKVKIRILAGETEWTCTLGVCQLEISGLKLPVSQAKDLVGRLGDRLFLLEEGIAHLDRRFQIFLDLRVNQSDHLLVDFHNWMASVEVANQGAAVFE